MMGENLLFGGGAAEAGFGFFEPVEDGFLVDVEVEAVALAAALDDAGFGEDFKVVGDGGLGEAELFGEFDDVVHLVADGFAREDLHDVEARGFAEGGEDFGEAIFGAGEGFGGAARGTWGAAPRRCCPCFWHQWVISTGAR
jgi:hypothetical protein